MSKRSSRSKIRTYCQQYYYSETHNENPKNVREVEQKSVQSKDINKVLAVVFNESGDCRCEKATKYRAGREVTRKSRNRQADRR